MPFGVSIFRPIVIPIELTATGYRMLDVDALRARGFVNMASWLELAQKIWEERRTEKSGERFPRVIYRLNYNGLLSVQNPSRRFVLLYNTSGTNLVSCVIDRGALPDIPVCGIKIKPRGFVAESTTYFYESDDENEVHYICAVLNSDIINELIKPLQPRGTFGERHIHRRPFMFPIPKFDPGSPLHTRLAELSKICHAKVASIRFRKKSPAGKRREARNVVTHELKEINELVAKLLGLG